MTSDQTISLWRQIKEPSFKMELGAGVGGIWTGALRFYPLLFFTDSTGRTYFTSQGKEEESFHPHLATAQPEKTSSWATRSSPPSCPSPPMDCHWIPSFSPHRQASSGLGASLRCPFCIFFTNNACSDRVSASQCHFLKRASAHFRSVSCSGNSHNTWNVSIRCHWSRWTMASGLWC